MEQLFQNIGKLLTVYLTLPLPLHIARMLEVGKKMVGGATFGGNWADRDICRAACHQPERDAIPDDRLLVFDVAEGWEPLCAFLQVSGPEMAFPNRNQQDDFRANLGGEPA